MFIGLMQNLPEIVMGVVYSVVVFWLGRKSVGFNLFEWVKSLFNKRR